MNRKWKIFFYLWFSIVPIFCILLDTFLSTTNPVNTPQGQGYFTSYFDLSVVSQLIYISVWTAILVAVFGILNFIALFVKKMPNWVSNKVNRTFVTSMTTMVFCIYLVAFIADPKGIVGMDVWYKILKSSLEHFATPILMLVFYLTYVDETPISCKSYAEKWGWYSIIFTSVYIIFIVIRAAMLYKYGPTSGYLNQKPEGLTAEEAANWTWKDNVIAIFPYEQVDPWTKSPALWIPACIGIVLAPYIFGNLLNWISNCNIRWAVDYKAKKIDKTAEKTK
ncbi:hypothetical protein [Mesoplasma lactucae]|uniref:Uncharacterized protein n=1 Tax=Mesoplasma lactucae ATCC 49193 TaxID=81460 RepID=A0A291IRX5_9MOLU|nr:hypothetical protein [Mesoplasma lactucae]ATG97510.1 hypothetical protein CP520_01950 [Mesoplasma lactucae ATCC 49193]ATZ20034.1 hypothetical protein MLACT_v1c02120 [Mesoplasma lactucae ATCC 49193]MCL8217015.1 hypothetical protein [Mesoplasma lactucae ATCC 49193]